jgi:hypothetical protein
LGLRQHAGGQGCVVEPLEGRRLMAATNGLAGTYYNTTTLTGPSKTRLDANVNFNFAKTALPAGVTASTYSVRWVGSIRPAFSQTYTFYTKSDEGVRVWVNHKLIIDNWKAHALTENSGSIGLNAGEKYDLQVEYFNNVGPAAAQLWWSSASVAKSVVPTSRLYARRAGLQDQIDHAFAFAESQMTKAIAQVGKTSLDVSDNSAKATAWTTTGPDAWTAGFFPGSMWQLYKHNEKKAWRLNATAWSRPIGASAGNGDDVGFRIWSSYFPLAGSTKLAADKAVLIKAADAKIANWNEKAGVFETNPPADKSSQPKLAVVLDQTMDVELLWWAWRETGKLDYRLKAIGHLLNVAKSMVRSDGSTIQLGYFDRQSGKFLSGAVKQGASVNSTWARGQAWALYSYAKAYQQTGDTDFLLLANKIANYWIANVPADGVPYWDFNAPGIPKAPRDSSAAAVAAAGLTLLGQAPQTASTKYRAAADRTLSSLLSPAYFAEGTGSPGLLLHGAHWVAKGKSDNTLIYADYYLLQAMNRVL